jgi:putative ABC transport system ATP-binding protein
MVLSVDTVRKSFSGAEGRVPVLHGVSLTLARGETMALTGESGSGKSTLLTLIAGLDRPDSGSIRASGREITTLADTDLARYRRQEVGLIFQQFNLIPSLDALANLRFQARLAGRDDPARTERLLTRLGLQDVRHRYPEHLSGGQQQRVAIGRTLAAGPALVLADEPTGNLDQATGDAVLDLMLDLVAETGSALLMVTHSDRLARRLSRRVHLSAGRVA